jgi:redox-sensitive bicupin YhaK (pirin superfamily)
MIRIRKASDRGHANHGWLESHHTFSFAGYHDPAHMGFGPLRVINEDRIQPGRGFDTHSHRDMEIITWVVDGALEHRDSMGNGSVIRPGDVQRMSAGTGVSHSEYNHSKSDRVHLLQIWILPEREGIPPSYEQKHFDADARRGVLRALASPDARDGSVRVHQDATLYATLLGAGESVGHELAPGRRAWVQGVRGAVRLGDVRLSAGDGAAISDERELRLRAEEPAELLVFDLGD